MRITDILRSRTVTVSCEIFPPKAGKPLENTKEVVRAIAGLSPSFISVTYGAGGTNAENSLAVAKEVLQNGSTALAHLTCVGMTREKLASSLRTCRESGIGNILALRGDIPEGEGAPSVFPHASDLIAAVKAAGDFCVGGACYPEGHPESKNSVADLDGVKRKVEAGCEFLTTQMFFDNNVLYSYLFRLMKSGIHVPVLAGIMPVTNAKQLSRIGGLTGTTVPPRFRAIVDRFADRPAAMEQAGIAYATEQIVDLIANDFTHIHIYTMNRPHIAAKIMANLSEVIGS